MQDRTLRMPEAAEYLGQKLRTFEAYYQAWGVPYYRVGKSVVFRESELRAYLDSCRGM